MIAASGVVQATKLLSTLSSELALALVDLDLPGMDGFQVIGSLKKAHPKLPVVAISGVFPEEILESAKCVGADDVLPKPIDRRWEATLERFRGISHLAGTGHFRCRCGERLVFGNGPGPFTPLVETVKVAKVKRGRCPRCGAMHRIDI